MLYRILLTNLDSINEKMQNIYIILKNYNYNIIYNNTYVNGKVFIH